MGTRSYVAPSDLHIAFGPEGCTCVDYADLGKLVGYNLPEKLKTLFADLAASKIDDWSELDVDSSDDTPNGSSNDGLRTRTTYRRGYWDQREQREWQEAAEEEDRQRQQDEDKVSKAKETERQETERLQKLAKEIEENKREREKEIERRELEAKRQKLEKERQERRERERQERQQREKEQQAKKDKDFKDLEAEYLRQKAEREKRDAAAAGKPASSAVATSSRMAGATSRVTRSDRYDDGLADSSEEIVIRRESRGRADATTDSPRVRRGSYSNYTGNARNRHRNRSADSFYDRFGRAGVLSLAFGSRSGEYGLVYTDRDQTYLDGPVFNRIKDLRDWLVPELSENHSIERTPIYRSDAGSLRVFLGPESTYFVFSETAWTFDTNIQDRTFRAWLRDCSEVERSGVYFRHGYKPHSLALGPSDMFCWIADVDFKVNEPFRQAFPGITAYLEFARREKLLEHVNLTFSPDVQPGTNLPYFVLTTADGVYVSSVPAGAADLIAKSTLKGGVLDAAKRSRKIKRLTSSAAANERRAEEAERKLTEATEILLKIKGLTEDLQAEVDRASGDQSLSPEALQARLRDIIGASSAVQGHDTRSRSISRTRVRSRSPSPEEKEEVEKAKTGILERPIFDPDA